MFRPKKSVKLPIERQMYIYSVSRLYKELSKNDRDKIKALCQKCGGEYSSALFEFVTTDTTATALEMKHYISRRTLYRIVKNYYEKFPKKL